jgi:hypothetical protein
MTSLFAHNTHSLFPPCRCTCLLSQAWAGTDARNSNIKGVRAVSAGGAQVAVQTGNQISIKV